MPNNSYTQQALAADPHFRKRVRSQLSSVAWQVTVEDPAIANHPARELYARQVIRQLDAELTILLPSFVVRPNVNNFETSYVFDFELQVGQVVTQSGDPDIASQLMSDWDKMAAAAGFTANPLGPAGMETRSAASFIPSFVPPVPPLLDR